MQRDIRGLRPKSGDNVSVIRGKNMEEEYQSQGLEICIEPVVIVEGWSDQVKSEF